MDQISGSDGDATVAVQLDGVSEFFMQDFGSIEAGDGDTTSAVRVSWPT